eukprot:3095857-Karenia_brevis.AAC.1
MHQDPALFERKTRWMHYGDMDDGISLQSRVNFVSAIDHVHEVEAMFQDDVAMGHMRKLSNREAEE